MDLSEIAFLVRTMVESALQATPQQNDVATRLCDEILARLDTISAEIGYGSGLDGAGGGGGGGEALPSVYDIVTEETGGQSRIHFDHRYYERSGELIEGPDRNLTTNDYGKFLAIKITDEATTIEVYGTLSALQNDMKKNTLVIIPLYKLDSNGGIEVDFRHLPRADAWSLNIVG